jgi:GDP/UDP-N,N'-diacetylbacillosamine 2-epimerase (hydrolysing)
MKKICVVTGTRADYGLLYWTMKEIKEDQELDLQLLATGMHLSPEFGLTYKLIENDGFVINKKIEILLSSDSSIGISKSMGLGMIAFAEAFTELQPDLVFLLGDRFEIFAAAAAATVSKIPIAHCHGGETTQGAFDEAMRHSITKMAQLHFTSTEAYRKRVIQLGENPLHVFYVGALGIENIKKLKLLNKVELEESIHFKFDKKNILVTFHPVTLENATSESQFSSLLKVLNELADTKIIFTKANADTDGRIINEMIDEFVKNRADKAIAFTSMGQLNYLSAMQIIDAVIGNSSSGIIEAPSFKKPAVNIGDRQLGRVSAESVINCNPDYDSVKEAVQVALSDSFKNKIQNVNNPYDNGDASEKITGVLKNTDYTKLLKKQFYDL